MKVCFKSFKSFQKILLLVAFVFTFSSVFSQNAIVGSGFTVGWGGACNSNTDFEYFVASEGGSYISTQNANATGNQYFRLGIDWGGTIAHNTITVGSDVAVSAETEYTLNSTCTTSGAMYINVSNTSDNYIFKTKDAGSNPSRNFLYFLVQGAVSSITSVSTPGGVSPGDVVTITAGLDASLNTGQGIYLRYTTDSWTSSTIIEMSGSGTTYTADITSGSNVLYQTVEYYAFSSGDGLTISPANADFYTINLNNNSSSNYSYTPSEITWANLQTPAGGTVMPGADFEIFAQVYANGVTTLTSESSAIQSWIGFSTTDTDPSTWAESCWETAAFDSKSSSNHEYICNVYDVSLSAGTYYYASRFKYNTDSYVYGGYDAGYWSAGTNVNGILRFGKNSTVSGNWEDDSSWDGLAPVLGEHVYIKNGDAIRINSDVQVNTVTIETGGTLVIADNQTLTIGPDGSFVNNGIFTANNSTIVLNGTSYTGGTSVSTFNNITVEGLDVTLDYTSTEISGVLDLKVGSIENAPHFVSGSTLKYSQGGEYIRVTEWNNPYNVTVANNTHLKLNIASFGGDLTVNGNLSVESGSIVDMESATDLFIVNGDLDLVGELRLSTAIGGDMEITGDWDRSGTFTPNSRLVSFTASSGTQEFNNHTTFDYIKIDNSGSELNMNAGMAIVQAMYVENGACLDMNTNIVDGAGSFELLSEGKIKIGSLVGITSSGATGNIQVTGTRTFSTGGEYHFTASDDQVPGNGMPSTVGDLIVDLATSDKTLTLASDYTVGNQFELNSGFLNVGSNNIIISNNSANSLIAGALNADFTNSYVIGKIKRNVSAVSGFYFPVGTSSNLQLGLLDLNSVTSGSSPYITSSYTTDASGIDISSLVLEVDGTLLTDRLDNGYWTFTPENVTTISYDITLDARNYSNGSTNEKAYALVKRNGGNWFLPDGTHDNATQSVSGGIASVKRSGVTSFSDYVIAYNKEHVTLPVELLSFKYEYFDEREVGLSWQTATEVNSDFFELQRSFNAQKFESIAIISAAGNTNYVSDYSYTDYTSGNTIYYRLKQVDYDNSYVYSDVISVVKDLNKEPKLEAFYSNGMLNIKFENLPVDHNTFYVYNSIGQIMQELEINAYGENYISVSISLKPGVYFIKSAEIYTIETSKFIVK